MAGYSGSPFARTMHRYWDYNDRRILDVDIDNDITLCKKCHNIVNGKEYEFIEQFEDIIRGKQI